MILSVLLLSSKEYVILVLSIVQENARSISHFTIQRFANAFLKFGNINLINDVIKDIHACGHKIDQVMIYSIISA